MQYPVVVCVFLLLTCGVTTPVDGHDPYGPAPAPDEDITVSYELSLRPDDPGVIGVTATVSLPDRVSRFELSLPTNATVSETSGIERGGRRQAYHWDGSSDRPSMTYTVRVNGSRPSEERTAALGDWGLVRLYTPRVRASWWAERPLPALGSEYHVVDDEAGFVGRTLAALGSHRTFERSVGNGTVRLVVPRGVEMAADPAPVLDSLVVARRTLDVGHRHDAVTGFVSPARTKRGGFVPNRGAPSFAVNRAEPVADPSNVWVHEYVHTRQSFATETDAAWLVEGSAQYYAALVTLRHGNVSRADFEDAVLSSGSSGVDLRRTGDRSIHYDRGAAVVAAIDARIRDATDGRRSFEDVFRRLNRHDELVDHAAFRAAVTAVAGEPTNETVDRLVAGESDAPSDLEPIFGTTGALAEDQEIETPAPDVPPADTPDAEGSNDPARRTVEADSVDREGPSDTAEPTAHGSDTAASTASQRSPGANGPGPTGPVLAGAVVCGLLVRLVRR